MNTDALARAFNKYSDPALSLALFVAGVVIILIAISPVNKWLKALALAYVVLP